MSLLDSIPTGASELVIGLLAAVFKAIRAGDDQAQIDEAAMDAAEVAKRHADRKKFGGG